MARVEQLGGAFIRDSLDKNIEWTSSAGAKMDFCFERTWGLNSLPSSTKKVSSSWGTFQYYTSIVVLLVIIRISEHEIERERERDLNGSLDWGSLFGPPLSSSYRNPPYPNLTEIYLCQTVHNNCLFWWLSGCILKLVWRFRVKLFVGRWQILQFKRQNVICDRWPVFTHRNNEYVLPAATIALIFRVGRRGRDAFDWSPPLVSQLPSLPLHSRLMRAQHLKNMTFKAKVTTQNIPV